MVDRVKQAHDGIDGDQETLTPERKARLINLDKRIFGTFAEIGAGQETARFFFRVGGAAATVAKTMSAYDMTFSDEIYGRATRYVSRERLDAMLSHEFNLLLSRLSAKRAADTTFFVFANTVATKITPTGSESHGWVGVRFQPEPLEPSNDIVLHVRLTDSEKLLQHEALGIVGVNVLYAAYLYHRDIDAFVDSLLDGLSTARIEIDMLEFRGPKFAEVDNRLVSLKLLRRNLTPAVILPPDGKVVQPSELLYQKELIVERGRFRPVTHLHVDMLEQAKRYVASQRSVDMNAVMLCEITLHNLAADEQLGERQLLAQSDELAALGFTTLISRYSEFHRLITFFRRYTDKNIYVVAGIDTVVKLFDEKFYADLDGGILEGLGRLFRRGINLLLYPALRDRFVALLDRAGVAYTPEFVAKLAPLVRLNDLRLSGKFDLLFQYLVDAGAMRDIEVANEAHLAIDTTAVLEQIQAGDPKAWMSIPASAAPLVKKHFSVAQKVSA